MILPRPVDFYKFFQENEEGHYMLGITKNPNIKLGDHEQIDEQSKEGNYVCVNGDVLDLSETPYLKLTKRDIALKYYEYGIHNKLFPLTFSCIVNTEEHCGKCWWCKKDCGDLEGLYDIRRIARFSRQRFSIR